MLESLHVKNIALIDETEVFFSKGLNILTGETGAGKSLVIGSIALALGGRADKNLIRQGADYALVELTFSVDDLLQQKLKELEIFPEDGQIVLTRKIMPAKSTCRINGETVSNGTIKEVAGLLLDLHAQHDNQILLKKQSHQDILDAYCKEELADLPSQGRVLYKKYCEKLDELENIAKISENRDRELDFANYEYQEIMQANLSEGEDETLENAYQRMKNERLIAENASGVANILGTENGASVTLMLDKALEMIRQIAPYDTNLAQVQDDLSNAAEIVNESYRTLNRYMDGFEFSQEEYLQTEARLNEINRLKDKFGFNISDVLQYAEQLSEKIEKLKDVHAYEEKLRGEVDAAKEETLHIMEQISEIRNVAAGKLEDELKRALNEMNFLDVQLSIVVEGDKAKLSANGIDDVEFLISLNPGEALKPLTKVASGGELSRIMLALKSIMARGDEIPTLIFDEIDTGISGITAWKVAEKLHTIACAHQVICITHLPQIAAMADFHYAIEKESSDQITTTNVRMLEEEQSVQELSRLLGSDEMNEAVYKNALALKEQAQTYKNK